MGTKKVRLTNWNFVMIPNISFHPNLAAMDKPAKSDPNIATWADVLRAMPAEKIVESGNAQAWLHALFLPLADNTKGPLAGGEDVRKFAVSLLQKLMHTPGTGWSSVLLNIIAQLSNAGSGNRDQIDASIKFLAETLIKCLADPEIIRLSQPESKKHIRQQEVGVIFSPDKIAINFEQLQNQFGQAGPQSAPVTPGKITLDVIRPQFEGEDYPPGACHTLLAIRDPLEVDNFGRVHKSVLASTLNLQDLCRVVDYLCKSNPDDACGFLTLLAAGSELIPVRIANDALERKAKKDLEKRIDLTAQTLRF